jgi:hypothetical protein
VLPSYDDEHHRLALIHIRGWRRAIPKRGTDHVTIPTAISMAVGDIAASRRTASLADQSWRDDLDVLPRPRQQPGRHRSTIFRPPRNCGGYFQSRAFADPGRRDLIRAASRDYEAGCHGRAAAPPLPGKSRWDMLSSARH